MTINDQINFSNPSDTLKTSYKIISAIQNERKGSQLMALAIVTRVLMNKLDVYAPDFLSKVDAVIRDAYDTLDVDYIRAIEMYVEKELVNE